MILQEILGVSVIVRHESSACAHVTGDVMDGGCPELVPFDIDVAYLTGLSDFIESWGSRERFEYDTGFMKVRDLDEHLFMVPVNEIDFLSDQGLDEALLFREEGFQHVSLFHVGPFKKERR